MFAQIKIFPINHSLSRSVFGVEWVHENDQPGSHLHLQLSEIPLQRLNQNLLQIKIIFIHSYEWIHIKIKLRSLITLLWVSCKKRITHRAWVFQNTSPKIKCLQWCDIGVKSRHPRALYRKGRNLGTTGEIPWIIPPKNMCGGYRCDTRTQLLKKKNLPKCNKQRQGDSKGCKDEKRHQAPG